SRMGMISALVSLGAMAAVVWIGRRRSPLPAALILLLLAGGIAASVWVGVGPVVEHFEQLPQNEPLVIASQGRVAVWNDTLKLIRAHPWAGVGLGCFEYAFTAVQSTELTYLVDHAHNDYLELAAELGVPCAALFFAAIFWSAARTFRASLRARSSLARALALASFGAIVALLAHGAADFTVDQILPPRRRLSRRALCVPPREPGRSTPAANPGISLWPCFVFQARTVRAAPRALCRVAPLAQKEKNPAIGTRVAHLFSRQIPSGWIHGRQCQRILGIAVAAARGAHLVAVGGECPSRIIDSSEEDAHEESTMACCGSSAICEPFSWGNDGAGTGPRSRRSFRR
ncbi:MAG: O-antigen ligase family protein, partial [Candidatus Acidiferrales bacterium]